MAEASACELVFLALGTRGDVQPMASLARAAAVLFGTRVAVVLVTHGAFAVALREPLARARVELRLLQSLPAARWGECVESAAPADAEARLRAECERACSGARALVFSLFALEGHALAEALRVPRLAVSPYLIPYGAPEAFEARLASAHPQLHAALRAAPATPASGERLCWAEVEHWAWPLFDDARWGDWRASLGLGRLPGLATDGRVALPAACHLAYLFPASLAPARAAWPRTVHAVGYAPDLPDAAPALPDAAPALPDATPRLRASARAPKAKSGARSPNVARAPPPLHACAGAAAGARCACEGAARARVYATVGSGAMIGGLLSESELCAVGRALEAACAHIGARALLHLPCGCPHVRALGEVVGRRVQLVCSDELRVRRLLRARHFGACVHHAGAGSTADALLSGTPAVALPLHFDQFAWAHTAQALGCARELRLQALADTPGDLGAARRGGPLCEALEEVLDARGGVARACARVRRALSVLSLIHI